MNRKQALWKARYYWQYFPFTINTILGAVVGWGAWWLLYKPAPKGEEPSQLMPFIILMGKIALWFLALLVLVSIISTFISYLHYLWLHRHKGVKLQVSFTAETRKGKRNKLFLNAQMEGVLRPVLGFVRGRLIYDDSRMTGRFSLLSNKKAIAPMMKRAIAGVCRIDLPDIKEYELRGGFVYFQDMLHLFSLASAQQLSGHFYQPPVLMEGDDPDVYPKKTESLDVRIEQLRRVEGEYLNYKDFESGDDVRRIVWKVYARNRELVVRVPELYEPYASHLYLYASFEADIRTQWLADGYVKEMLNYYKNNVWTVYDTLSKKEWEMRFIPDQQFNVPDQHSGSERAARIIGNSYWHKEASLDQYFNPKKGAVLCISSFTDPRQLADVLERCDAGTIIYFVKLSNAFSHLAALGLLGRVLLQPPRDRLARLRARWLFSPMRLQVQKKEKEIIALLKASNVTYGEL
jgi:Protein of unknown function DUF58